MRTPISNDIAAAMTCVLGHAEFLHHGVARGADAEAVDAEDLALGADVFPPQAGDAGFDGDALGAGGRQHAFAVLGALAVEEFEAGHGNDADAVAEFGGGGHARVAVRSRWRAGWW